MRGPGFGGLAWALSLPVSLPKGETEPQSLAVCLSVSWSGLGRVEEEEQEEEEGLALYCSVAWYSVQCLNAGVGRATREHAVPLQQGPVWPVWRLCLYHGPGCEEVGSLLECGCGGVYNFV